jgi:hypothetical protein
MQMEREQNINNYACMKVNSEENGMGWDLKINLQQTRSPCLETCGE